MTCIRNMVAEIFNCEPCTTDSHKFLGIQCARTILGAVFTASPSPAFQTRFSVWKKYIYIQLPRADSLAQVCRYSQSSFKKMILFLFALVLCVQVLSGVVTDFFINVHFWVICTLFFLFFPVFIGFVILHQLIFGVFTFR